jgi:hypothetical protein
MVFLVLSRAGFDELVRDRGRVPSPLWVTAGVLSDTELSELRSQGIDVTDFTWDLEPGDSLGLEVALDTVREHHPSEHIWVEYAPNL